MLMDRIQILFLNDLIKISQFLEPGQQNFNFFDVSFYEIWFFPDLIAFQNLRDIIGFR